MNTRERVRGILDFMPVDRLPVAEWAPWWDATLERWKKEGLPHSLEDRYEICRHFGLDLIKYNHYEPFQHGCPTPSAHGAGIVHDSMDYDRILPFLYGPLPDPEVLAGWAEEQKRGEIAVWFNVDGFFFWPRALFGIEEHLFAFHDQGELMHRINADLAAWHIRLFDEICLHLVPDFYCFAEDMSYNQGPMISRTLFDGFLRPYYEQVVPHIKSRGCKVFVDTDGDVTEAMLWYHDVGIEGFLPLERNSGVDVVALRERFPGMRFLGAFDKLAMSRGEAAMRAEFDRLLPVMRGGGFIVGCDHQTPPGVSYEDYHLFLRLFREYAERAGTRS